MPSGKVFLNLISFDPFILVVGPMYLQDESFAPNTQTLNRHKLNINTLINVEEFYLNECILTSIKYQLGMSVTLELTVDKSEKEK